MRWKDESDFIAFYLHFKLKVNEIENWVHEFKLKINKSESRWFDVVDWNCFFGALNSTVRGTSADSKPTVHKVYKLNAKNRKSIWK